MTQKILFLLILPNPQQPELLVSTEPLQALATIKRIVLDGFSQQNPANTQATTKALSTALDYLETLVLDQNQSLVDRSGSHLETMEVDGPQLFGSVPRLPAEDKNNGHWSFKPTRLELKTQNLFIHAMTIKASRTIRLKRVTLYFYDGKPHSFEYPDPKMMGNGLEFKKRQFLPWIRLLDGKGIPKVRKLKAIEILGSAQDGHFNAVIDLKFLMPGYSPGQPEEALNTISRLRRNLHNAEQSAKHLAATLGQIEGLEQILAGRN